MRRCPRLSSWRALGKSAGEMVHSLSWGRDGRAVVADRELKSIGHEETYPTDVVDRDELERRLVLLADSVAARIRRHGVVARTLTLKFRYGDFTTLTRSHTFATPQMSGPGLWTAAKELLGSLELRNGVRLLGLSASGLVPVQSAPGEQLQLELSAAATVSQEGVAPLQSNDAAQEPGAVTASSAAGSRPSRKWCRARLGAGQPGNRRGARPLRRRRRWPSHVPW